MQDWQLRIIQEQADLKERIDKLRAFLANQNEDWFYTPMGAAMGEQYQAMLSYQSALNKRIKLFGG